MSQRRTSIAHILVCADDIDQAAGRAEAVLEPSNWDFFTMVTPVDGSNGHDGLKPICAADVGSAAFIKKLREFERQRKARVVELSKGIKSLTISHLIADRPDDLFQAIQALQIANGYFLQDSPFLNAIDVTARVPDVRLKEIKQEPDKYWLVPVELWLV
jgi:hypothetical protein